ncbi:MAG: YicC/YloC family endoribonuclease [Candidatus Zixiibacteriota bacterium]
MLLSMTGYGSARKKVGEFTVSVNLQSLNSRYLEQRFRLQSVLGNFENPLRETVTKKFTRGEVMITAELVTGKKSPYNIDVNYSALGNYVELLEQLRKKNIETSPITLRDVLTIEDVLIKKLDDSALNEIENALFSAFDDASDALIKMQIKEGKNLQEDILERIDRIAKQTAIIKSAEIDLPELAKERIKKLQNSLPASITPERLAQEVTLALSKMDISEEIVRLDSHIEQFKDTVKQEPPVGTKLNFIIQEIHREANTIAAKSQVIDIVSSVIEIKEQTERIREQLRNVQ